MSLETGSPEVVVLRGTVAKVVGLPGFMETRPKWMVPLRERSMVGLRRSSSPIETPPEVTMTSTVRNASRRCSSREPGLGEAVVGSLRGESVGGGMTYLSLAIPRSVTWKPQPLMAAMRVGRLQSRTSPSCRGPCLSWRTISSPVLSTPMMGFL